MSKNEEVMDKLFNTYAHLVSSDEESGQYLKEAGHDPDQLVKDGLQKIKQMKLALASKNTEQNFADLKNSLIERAKNEVEKLLSDVTFNINSFIKSENIHVAYKNFDTMKKDEMREFLERYFLLKFENESKINTQQ